MKNFLFAVLASLSLLFGAFASASEKESVSDLENGVRGVANATMSGNLTGSQTFDRRFLVTYDGTCAASSDDSSNDGTPFQVFPIYSPTGQAADIEVSLGSLGDSVLFIYCDPFDETAPASNIRAWDDDDGVGFGSAIVPADGVMLEAGVQYFAVVAGFTPSSTGTFDISLGGDIEFGSPLPESTPVPIDSTWTLLVLVVMLSGIGLVVIRRVA